MINCCKICGESYLVPLWHACDVGFYRCLICGCDSSDKTYEEVKHIYCIDYLKHNGTAEENAEQMQTNIDWFEVYRKVAPSKDFLDIGHNEGGGLLAMQRMGWRVHGFDVNPVCDYGPHTTIAPCFAANLFPQKYGAVLCREVIEHVEGWRQLLIEIHNVMLPGGLLQLQTPLPDRKNGPMVYQLAHLQIFTPHALKLYCRDAGFEVLDWMLWYGGERQPGQCGMLKRL